MFRAIIFVITPPSVSIPSDSGVTSNNKTSVLSPASTAPWIAAPTAKLHVNGGATVEGASTFKAQATFEKNATVNG